ncbi:MAG: glycosyltransferase family 9 protein [Flavobacteriales bacterium]|nr:glycosyltransferase family 9 protein [Flavobacteriales bacterium]
MSKILVVRFSSIGDIVLTTPVVRCLKEQLPDSKVHYLTKTAFASILEGNPHIDKLYTIQKDVSEQLKALKAENYDHIVDLHHNLRTAILKSGLKKPTTSFNKINFQKWLKVKFKMDRLPPTHIVERYLETVKTLGVKNDHKGLDYFVPSQDEVGLSELPLSHQNGYVGFVIGAKQNTKKMPLEKIISICKKLSKPILLLGGKEDMANAEEILKAVGPNAYSACGKFNINQSASLVRQADKIITHDTGLMHIAAAFGKEIISIWGNTIPAFGMYPYLTGHGDKGAGKIMEVEGLNCRPCSKLGFDKCPKGHFKCMLNIDIQAIVDAAK